MPPNKTRFAAICLAVALLQACAAVTITPEGQPKTETTPDFTQKMPLYFFGLKGEPHVDVKAVCGNRKVRQLQTIDEFSDRVLTVVTLAIYTPRTAKVWCEKEGDAS